MGKVFFCVMENFVCFNDNFSSKCANLNKYARGALDDSWKSCMHLAHAKFYILALWYICTL